MTAAWWLVMFALGAADDPQRVAESAFAAGVQARSSAARARPLFRQSADAYADLRKDGVDTVALHRNEGHARALAGDIPGAILAYHRGLRLDPDDAGLQAGLAYARSEIAFASPEEALQLTPRAQSWSAARRALRRHGLYVLAALSLAGWAALTAWLTTRRHRWLIAALILLALAALWTGARFWEDNERKTTPPPAVVVQPAFLRKGDGTSYPLRRETPLPAGTEVTVRSRRGDWAQVELANGTLGWLAARVVGEP